MMAKKWIWWVKMDERTKAQSPALLISPIPPIKGTIGNSYLIFNPSFHHDHMHASAQDVANDKVQVSPHKNIRLWSLILLRDATTTRLKGICTTTTNECCYGLIVAIQMESTQSICGQHTHTQIQPLRFLWVLRCPPDWSAQVASGFVGKVAAEILPSQCLKRYQLDQEKKLIQGLI